MKFNVFPSDRGEVRCRSPICCAYLSTEMSRVNVVGVENRGGVMSGSSDAFIACDSSTTIAMFTTCYATGFDDQPIS